MEVRVLVKRQKALADELLEVLPGTRPRDIEKTRDICGMDSVKPLLKDKDCFQIIQASL